MNNFRLLNAIKEYSSKKCLILLHYDRSPKSQGNIFVVAKIVNKNSAGVSVNKTQMKKRAV